MSESRFGLYGLYYVSIATNLSPEKIAQMLSDLGGSGEKHSVIGSGNHYFPLPPMDEKQHSEMVAMYGLKPQEVAEYGQSVKATVGHHLAAQGGCAVNVEACVTGSLRRNWFTTSYDFHDSQQTPEQRQALSGLAALVQKAVIEAEAQTQI